MASSTKRPYFYSKKYCLLFICVLQTTIAVVISTIKCSNVDKSVHDYASSHEVVTSKEELASIRVYFLVVYSVCATVPLIFYLLGFIGVWKEHFCLSCAYAIFCCSASCPLEFWQAVVYDSVNWFFVAVDCFAALVAVLFTVDLWFIRRQANYIEQTAVHQRMIYVP